MTFPDNTGLLHRTLFLLLLLLAIRPVALYATDSVSITHLSIDQGLSNNSVRCIYQDHNGFMWFGTSDGLNKYDGYTFTVYRNNPRDPHSISGNFIQAIINFLIIALVIFMIVRTINQIKRRFEREKEDPAAPAEPSAQEKLLMEIRDLLGTNVESRRM